jgi:uncharacterized protein
MAETLLSPGVLARENDNTFIQQQPIQAGASIVGPAVKGPVEIPTLVTTYTDYQNRFGTTFESGSDEYTYLTSVAAYNYFNNGGDSLLVTRVVSASGNWTYSSASINNTVSVTGGAEATASFGLAAVFNDNEEVKLNYDGVEYRFIAEAAPLPADSVQGRIFYFETGSTADASAINFSASFAANINFINVSQSANNLFFSSSAEGTTYNGVTLSTGSSSDFSVQATLGGGVNGVGTSTAFEIEVLDRGELFNNTSSMLSNGALSDGTKDDIRWEVASSDAATGQFSILVRRGDDNTSSKTVLEQWTNLSLDPKSPNYISAVIGDQKLTYDSAQNYIKVEGDYPNASRYIRVKSVLAKTPNYFDNAGVAKPAYATSLPVVGSGSYGGAFDGGVGSLIPTGHAANYYDAIDGTDTQGLEGSDYTDMLSLLANSDDYVYNLMLLPGLTDVSYSSQITTAISNAQSRGDHLVIIDPTNYGATITAATTEATGRDTSYAAMYWPWLRTIDPDLGKNIWVPASTMIGGVYAFNDNSSEPWFAPAGINRGGLGTVVQAERKLSATNRDSLYEGNVNPIATFPGTGVVVYGQKTLQKKASALDRVNVRRLLIELKSYISQVALNLVFEQNTAATRNNFLATVNPYLESVQARQGLYAFKVIMDDSNNTPDVIDRNQMVGQIFIQPTRTAEFIYLDFNLQPTGATFPS